MDRKIVKICKIDSYPLLCTNAPSIETFLSPIVESLLLAGKITPKCFEIPTKPHEAGVCFLTNALVLRNPGPCVSRWPKHWLKDVFINCNFKLRSTYSWPKPYGLRYRAARATQFYLLSYSKCYPVSFPDEELFDSVQLLSRGRLFATPWTAASQASLSITNSWSPPKPMSIELVMLSNPLILCRLLLPPSISPSIRIFSKELLLRIRWPKYWSFNFNTSPSNEYSGLISFRMDWLDLLAVQGTLKSLQHHSSKVSILQCTAFFIVQLSHPHMTMEIP